jgi:replication factor C subunit 1
LKINININGPLNGMTFVITGVIDKIGREDLKNILKGYGGKVTNSVSFKTTYLVAGEYLEDGRPKNQGNKYRKAEEIKTKIISYDELQEIIRDKLNDPLLELDNLDWKGSNSKPKYIENKKEEEEKEESNLEKNENKKNSNFGFLKKIDNDIDIKMNIEKNNDENFTEDKNKTVIMGTLKNTNNSESDLWTTKHTPDKIKDIIGNGGSINKIIDWLNDWNDVHLNGNKKEVENKSNPKFKNENPNAKAILISGDPGIGKTSSIRLLAKLKGYKLFELNASDQRNKKVLMSKVGYLVDSKTISKTDEKTIQKNLILMDEIDGMSGNEDRGGVATLIQIIKMSKTPIICICNDRQNQKLKSLTNYCYDIKFNKPDKRQVTKRLIEICKMENMNVEENAIENLCESVGNDIRQCLNFLQMWSRKYDQLKYFDMKNNYDKFSKDTSVMISHFDGVTKLLSRKDYIKMNFREKLNMFYLDYDLVPLLIQENYLTCYSAKDADAKSLNTLKKIAKSADHISFGDTINKRIRMNNNWNLLQDNGIHSSVAVGNYSANFLGFPKFPE